MTERSSVSDPGSRPHRDPRFGPGSEPNSGRPIHAAAAGAVDLRGLTETYCPVCGARLDHEKCKVVCRSKVCVHRIVYNCAEF